jgi:hypothetical protein
LSRYHIQTNPGNTIADRDTSMARRAQRADENQLPWHEAPSISPARPPTDERQRLIQAMIALLMVNSPNSDAEALRMLRDEFPDTPLALRIAAFSNQLKRARMHTRKLTSRDKRA